MTADPPIIDYASPVPPDPREFAEPMLRWRSRCGMFCLALAAIVWVMLWASSQPAVATIGTIGLGFCLISIVVCAAFTIIQMAKIAAAAVSVGYAVTQVSLAIFLTPLLLLGVFVMPMLVQSDVLKWRRTELRESEVT